MPMIWYEVNWDLCQACQPCEARKACKVRAIVKLDPDGPAVIDLTRCNGCGACVEACSFNAIEMKTSYPTNI